ncbi:putative fungal cellulose binding domain protein [Lasiodiplodia theobromae]|uniref:lytic cellulose monooxygenase (C4-dehydrogenating) n=1 Tax=Lasiodiplodia theobromae TaxID=45133 RepID=A0A5N5D342_9PEZI|nr:putative endo-beta-1,4-glucanase D [Lasiodiplodia theobromae]KAF9640151.1 putative fungal cellulose binding domain protein [Lasiodiplodia theobromae]
MQFSLATIAAVAAMVPSISAHYCFNKLIVDGAVVDAEPYEYVRQNTNANSPVTDVSSNDLRCNVGGLASGSSTKTKEVAPGAEVGFALDSSIGHPGPLQVYMSKADSTAAEYDGSGDWFKVYEMGPGEITDDGLQWLSNGLTNFTFPLPEETPAGEYLLRVEHVGLHGASEVGGAQFYISCAQIKVTGSGAGSPAPTVKIPGVYTGEEPGLKINIYWPIPTNYTMPGPAVWPEGSGSASSGSAATPAASTPAASTPSQVAQQAVAAVSTPAAVPTPQVIPTPVVVPTPDTPLFTPPAYTPVTTPSTGTGSSVKKYGQCGGSNYKGSTECESGLTCKAWNDYYSQCL